MAMRRYTVSSPPTPNVTYMPGSCVANQKLSAHIQDDIGNIPFIYRHKYRVKLFSLYFTLSAYLYLGNRSACIKLLLFV